MRTIWKYGLPWLACSFSHEMPAMAEVIHVATQDTKDDTVDVAMPMMWCSVDTEAPLVTHRFIVVGTGWEIPPGRYVGSYAVNEYVWHLFDAGEERP